MKGLIKYGLAGRQELSEQAVLFEQWPNVSAVTFATTSL